MVIIVIIIITFIRMRISLVLAFTAGIFLFSCNTVWAQDTDVGRSLIHPAHPLYFLKTLRESLELKFAGTSNIRGLRYLEFSTRRIREVKSLVSSNHEDLIHPTLENYWLNLDKLLGLINFRDEVIANQVTLEIKKQLITLQKVYDQIENTRAKMALRTAIHRISGWNTAALNRLSLDDRSKMAAKVIVSQILACNFLTKEASASGLNEIERAVLLERAQNCQKFSQFD